jgi:hypothetical protein
MRLKFYGNRVRIEPGAFGERGRVIDAIAGQLAPQVPDAASLLVSPSANDLERAREPFAHARAILVPPGFVRC